MADLIIRGMEMPESCDKCNLFNGCWCMALGIGNWRKSYCKPEQGERLPDCPLVPLPEGHGRLIDADALREDWLQNGENEFVYDTNSVLDSIDNAPTIVPAEGGGEDGWTPEEEEK